MLADKKKIVVFGSLVAVILGIGAFQFVGGGTTAPAPVVKSKPKPRPADEKPLPRNPTMAAPLAERDPFLAETLPGQTPPAPAPNLAPPVPPRASTRTARMGMPAFPMDRTGQLPAIGDARIEPGAGGVKPLSVKPEDAPFEYRLAGTVTGARPVAVFVDGQGNQRLVSEKGTLDGDTKVIDVGKHYVVVSRRGKWMRLTQGGKDEK